MKIHILRKTKFDKYLQDRDINDTSVSGLENTAFISILNSGSTGSFTANHSNVLVLHFDDILSLDPNAEDADHILFSKDHGQQIVAFIDRVRDTVDDLYIHCSAGISRSGAVGEFLCQYLELDQNVFIGMNPQIRPNPFISQMLREQYINKVKNN